MSTAMSLERKHIPPLPTYLTILRIVQLVLGIIILGISAYGVSVDPTPGLGLTIFTSIVTIIIVTYDVVTERHIIIAFSYWAVLALDLFLIIFWLCSFAKDAAEANTVDIFINNDGYYLVGQGKTWRNVLITCAVLGSFQFLLFVASFMTTTYYVQKHRDAGGHCIPFPRGGNDIVMNHPVAPEDPSVAAAAYTRTPPIPPIDAV